MDGINGAVPFGALTSKTVHYLDFSKLDTDNDGIITEEEIISVVTKPVFDTLDLSCIDKDADQKVTQEEYELWQQEEEIAMFLKQMKNQAVKDFIGLDEDDIKTLMKAIDDFRDSFIDDYLIKNDCSQLAKAFKMSFPLKYIEIKQYVLSNTKSAVKNRVIDNVISQVIEENNNGERNFAGLFSKGYKTLSDNAKRLLGSILSKESDKFIKKYDGDNLEEDLTAYLLKYLTTSDQEKLSEQIYIWEISKQNLEQLSSEEALAKVKTKAKEFIQIALDKGISLALGNISIRTEVAIIPALSQYKDYASLIEAVDKIIMQLSKAKKYDEIIEDDQTSYKISEEMLNIKTDGTNIFK